MRPRSQIRAARIGTTSVLALSLCLCLGSCKEKKSESASGVESERIIPPTPGKMVSVPLPPPTQSEEGSPLFASLAPEKTGLDFQMQLGDFGSRAKEYLFVTPLGGVATGDYDGDGKPDLYLTSPSGGNRLYRNLGEFKFEDVTEESGTADPNFWGTGASFVDIDNDGDLDLYACGYRQPNKLFLNDGKGQFVERAREFGLAFEGASMSMAFADIDNDGDLDGYLATTTQPPPPGTKFGVRMVKQADGSEMPVIPEKLAEYWQFIYLPEKKVHRTEAGQYDHLYRNDGGKFVDVSKQAGIDGNYFTLSATWWDYDSDGDPDLYVSNDFTGPDMLYRNRGDGTFEDVIKTTVPHTPWFSMGSDIGDLDGDGRIDLFATDMAATSHYREKIMMGNMDDMGWFLEFPEPRQYMRNALYLNNDTGRMMEAAYLAGIAGTDWSWSPRLEDFDGDGRVDLFVTNGILRDSMHSDLSAMAEKQFRPGSDEWRAFWASQEMRKEKNLAFRNEGDLKFVPSNVEWGLDREGVSFGAATADFDGDGDLDLVVNNADAPASLYENRTQAHRIIVALEGTRSNRFGIGAKVEIVAAGAKQIREMTPVRGWLSSNEPVAQFGLGSAAQIESLTVRWPSGAVQFFENLPANQRFTITEPGIKPQQLLAPAERLRPLFVAAPASATIRHTDPPFDDFASQPLLPNKLSQRGPALAWGDLDGDDKLELYLGGARGIPGKLFTSKQALWDTELSLAALEEDRQCEDTVALFFDAEGDGDLDLLVGSGSVEAEAGSPDYYDRLYLNDGSGNLTRAPAGTIPAQAFNTSALAAADFDKDGDLDLIVARYCEPGSYPLAHPSAYWRNTDGKFTDVTETELPILATIGLATAVLASDADGDSWIDLLITVEWGTVRLIRNKSGKLIEEAPAGALAKTGWWNGIAGGDVDGDGDLDYVVTNYGLNTKYKASKERPAEIFYGDLDGSGKRHLIEVKYEGDTAYPVRGFSCSRAAMPSLDARLKTFHNYASSSLTTLYPNIQSQSVHLKADTLESGILINDGSARFAWRSLPRLAQIAPAFGTALADFNGDGHLDLVLAQNSFSPQRETGRMDGGLSMILLGDGAGNFTPLAPHESGLVIPGAAVAVGTPDLNADGRPDLAIAENNGPLHVLINASRSK